MVVKKSDKEWQEQLSHEQYRVTREHATERPFTGEYVTLHDDGTYTCVCCGAPLFGSEAKYDSHSGWPSFFQPLSDAPIGTTQDNSFFMRRTEVHCENCGAHLGHVFDDGPDPTGMRYCINSAALKFEPEAAKEGQDDK